MIVQVNGEARELRDGATVDALLDALALDRPTRGVAIAVGHEVVPRAQWPSRVLAPGDRVEVLSAMQGG